MTFLKDLYFLLANVSGNLCTHGIEAMRHVDKNDVKMQSGNDIACQ